MHKARCPFAWKVAVLTQCLDLKSPRLRRVLNEAGAITLGYARLLWRLKRTYEDPQELLEDRRRALNKIGNSTIIASWRIDWSDLRPTWKQQRWPGSRRGLSPRSCTSRPGQDEAKNVAQVFRMENILRPTTTYTSSGCVCGDKYGELQVVQLSNEEKKGKRGAVCKMRKCWSSDWRRSFGKKSSTGLVHLMERSKGLPSVTSWRQWHLGNEERGLGIDVAALHASPQVTAPVNGLRNWGVSMVKIITGHCADISSFSDRRRGWHVRSVLNAACDTASFCEVGRGHMGTPVSRQCIRSGQGWCTLEAKCQDCSSQRFYSSGVLDADRGEDLLDQGKLVFKFYFVFCITCMIIHCVFHAYLKGLQTFVCAFYCAHMPSGREAAVLHPTDWTGDTRLLQKVDVGDLGRAMDGHIWWLRRPRTWITSWGPKNFSGRARFNKRSFYNF